MLSLVAGQPQTWDNQIAGLPGAHVLQTWEWAQVKARVGWQAHPSLWQTEDGCVRAAAMLLIRPLKLRGLALPVSVGYVPKGPLLDWSDRELRGRVLRDLEALARQRGAIFLKIDPDVVLGTGVPGEEDASETTTGQDVTADLDSLGWHFSTEQIQFRNTVCIDLVAPEDELLARMKQKMRYNIRLAERKGVRIRAGSQADLPLLYRLYAETSVRDGFVIREEAYYRAVWSAFLGAGLADAWIAEVETQPVAGMIVFHFGQTAWYLYGMSSQAHREKMPNALLQWETIRRARQTGCRVYDLWGAPDVFTETDPMWGVFRFKEGLGGQVVRTLGAWDRPLMPWAYALYTRVIPRLLDRMRRQGRAKTRRQVVGE